MIRLTLFFIYLLAFSATPAQAELWLFGGKKKQEKTVEPGTTPKVFVKPENDDSNKKWVLDKLLNRSPAAQQKLSPIFDDKAFEKLTPEMLTASYSPKTQEELGMIAVAHNIWQGSAIEQMQKEAQERIAAAKKRTDEALKKMAKADAAKANDVLQTETAAPQPKKPALYNSPVLNAPKKVFTDYQ